MAPVLSPMPMSMSGSPAWRQPAGRSRSSSSSMSSAARQARSAWSGWACGAPQKAMMASPMYLSSVPWWPETMMSVIGRQVLVEQLQQHVRVEPLGDGGEAADVGEERGQLALLAAELQRALPPQHLVDDGRRQEAARSDSRALRLARSSEKKR